MTSTDYAPVALVARSWLAPGGFRVKIPETMPNRLFNGDIPCGKP